MKKNLQKLLAIVMALAIALGMAACGNSNAPATDAPATEAGKVEDNTPADTTPAEEKVVLKVHFFENATGDVWFQTLKAGFEEKYPNVTVELKGDAEITQKMGPMLEANDTENLPDVAFVLNTSWQLWADKGYLADLTDLYEGLAWEGDVAFKDTMNSGAQSYSMYRGKATIIPWSDGVLGLAYNKGMFEEHGWEVPSTWTELLALCEEIKAAGIAPFTYPGQIMGYWDFTVQNMIASYSGMEAHNAYLAMESVDAWKDEGRLAAYTKFEELFDKGYMLEGSEALNHTASQMEFVNGRAAMIPNGSWLEAEMAAATPEGFKMAMMPVPVLEDGEGLKVTYNMIGDFIMVPAASEHQDWAKEFIKFACSEEMNRKATELMGTMRPFDYSMDGIAVSDFTKSCLEVMNTCESFNMNTTSAMLIKINSEFAGAAGLSNIATGMKSAQEQYDDEIKYVEDNWDAWKTELGQ